MLKKLVSRVFGPKDFSVGLIQEMLVTLCKVGFTPDVAKEITNVKTGKAKQIMDLFGSVSPHFRDLRRAWEKFYQRFSNLTLDFSGIRIPECPGRGWRLLIIAQGITPEQVFQVCSKQFKTWKYTDRSLDEVVTQNERTTETSYAIWVKDFQEADEIHKDKSADTVKEEGLLTETLTERFIHELARWNDTSNHLDIRNITLCSGSRYLDGDVPSVYWYDDRLYVCWYSPGTRYEALRPREVVS